MFKYRYIYFETDAIFALYLFPVIYMSLTGIKGETQMVQSLVQPVLQVSYGDI